MVQLGCEVDLDAYFSLLTHTKQLLLVIYCHMTAGNGVSFWTNARTDRTTDGKTDVVVEIVIYIDL